MTAENRNKSSLELQREEHDQVMDAMVCSGFLALGGLGLAVLGSIVERVGSERPLLRKIGQSGRIGGSVLTGAGVLLTGLVVFVLIDIEQGMVDQIRQGGQDK